MPLDVLGRTRATLMHSTSLTLTERSGKPSNLHRDGDRLLQLLIFNEEYLVGACHQRASITSLPFVHTARRYYRLNHLVRSADCCASFLVLVALLGKRHEPDDLEEVKVVTRFP